MGTACGTCGVQEVAYRVLVGKSEGKRPLGRPRRRWEEGKVKAVPLQAGCGPEGSRKLRFLDYMKTAQDGGKVVSPTHRPPLPPGNAPGAHLC